MSQKLRGWLESLGIVHQLSILANPDRSYLISEAIKNDEGQLTHKGALGVITTPYTGRSPKDKYIVDYGKRTDLWWGDVNKSISPEVFTHLKNRIAAYLNNRPLYIIDCFIGADADYQLKVRVVTEFAWQALAAQNLFIYTGSNHHEAPDITILVAPDFHTHPEIDQVASNAAICIDLEERTVLIAASKYMGEIKKSAFTIMNALLPESNVLPMHCSANVGEKGDVALFFGLSGTGKTTLSSTMDRKLVGDDEHGWGSNGIFNFEGGCYAKVIRLDPDLEPVIWKASNQYGSVLENVVISSETRLPDFEEDTYTENTRAVYPLSRVANIIPSGVADHPTHIFFLSADACGVLPPVAKLTSDEVSYYFLSGYTSKVAGTERGLGGQPEATFSTCFGEPFLPLKPKIYAQLLKEKINQHQSQVWLINTGWTGGGFNQGHRIPLPHTRRMVNWILNNEYKSGEFHSDSIFDLQVPDSINGVPTELLYPEKTWKDHDLFIQTAGRLKTAFDGNFQKFV